MQERQQAGAAIGVEVQTWSGLRKYVVGLALPAPFAGRAGGGVGGCVCARRGVQGPSPGALPQGALFRGRDKFERAKEPRPLTPSTPCVCRETDLIQ